MGFVLVPASCFLLGVMRNDLLSGAYLLLFAAVALRGCGGLMPAPVLLRQVCCAAF